MTAGNTPMMRQYMEIKREHPDEILFFRLGDFYEMFLEDAELASRELEITLTGREAGLEERIPMCGVPYHAVETYIARLIQKGYKVAICEQTEDPKATKGIVRREVIKIITPGTVLSEAVLADSSNRYIALVGEADSAYLLAGADVSTGECFYGVYGGDAGWQTLLDVFYRLMPSEILLLPSFSRVGELKEFVQLRMTGASFTAARETEEADALVARHFAEAERPEDGAARAAVGTLLAYLHRTVKTDLTHLNRLSYLDATENLIMDAHTLRNLEITRNLRDGGKKDTLLSVLDFTHTAMGARLLKKWLEYPLLHIGKIRDRQDAVAELLDNFLLRGQLAEHMKTVYDFERLITRIEVGTANARDLNALRCSLENLPALKADLAQVKSRLLVEAKELETYEDTTALLRRAICDEPAFSVRDGGIIREGYSAELDELRTIAKDSRRLLQEMEQKEKESTGIRSLKIGYNKVFGYYIEVRHSSTDSVPLHYVRKQTLANAERYITPELKEFETKILGAQERIVQLEYQIFSELRLAVKALISRIQQTAHAVALVDALASLAEAASQYNYARPEIVPGGEITIQDGRHPLVERMLTRELFVPNDTALSHADSEILVITGPNMAGKSTYMRQVALLVLLAQVGSFIPARAARISPVDRIFTRIGASDDLASGQSTFMVEMNEVAQILKFATKRSLIILDEIGRGTSTFDGMSIARAVIEHIRARVGAKTLFATHYHELTDLENYDARIKNCSVAVKERGAEVVFLRRIVAGGADKSYGIHVAKLAGLPRSVTDRARKILEELETLRGGARSGCAAAQTAATMQPEAPMTSLFSASLTETLLGLDVMSMTPLEALNALYQLQNQAKGEAGK